MPLSGCLRDVSRSRNGVIADHRLPLCVDSLAFSISSTNAIGFAVRDASTARAGTDAWALVQPFGVPPYMPSKALAASNRDTYRSGETISANLRARRDFPAPGGPS